MGNVPIGEDEQLTAYVESPLAPSESPKRLLISVWATMVFLSLYGAHDLYAFVSFDERLARIWAKPAGLLVKVAGATGFLALREPLAAFAQLVDTPHVVLEKNWAPPGLAQEQTVSADGGVVDDGALAPVDAHQTPNEPLRPTRVLVVGASSVQYYLGAELERRLELYRDVTVYRSGRISTGLARPDMFDWPKETDRLQREFKPDLMIAMFGGNDTQGLLMPDGSIIPFGTEEWHAAYSLRVRTMIEHAAQIGAKSVMLGMPSMRQPKYSKSIAEVNEVTRNATMSAGGIYIDTWDISATPAMEYQEAVTYKGETGLMRLPDGQHLSRLGARFTAEALMNRLEREFAFTAIDTSLATVARYEVTSKILNRAVPYLAFVPQGLAENEKLPVVYLLHGAGGSERDWSEHAHELLQRAATKHRLIFIAPDGGADSWYLDSKRLPGEMTASFLTEELMKDAAKRLPVLDTRGVLGISMGGNAAIAIAVRKPKLFAAVSSLSGAVDLSEAQTRSALIARLGPYEENPAEWEASSALHMVRRNAAAAKSLHVRLSTGKSDVWAKANRALNESLLEEGADATFKESEGTHSWATWVAALPAHLEWQAKLLHEAAMPGDGGATNPNPPPKVP